MSKIFSNKVTERLLALFIALFNVDGAQYLRLETIGRKSGKTHQVVVRYIALDNKIIVFPGKKRN